MGERVGQIAKVPEVKHSNSNSRVRRTEHLQSMDTPADRILFLQRTAGNQAVQRLVRSGALQAKLRIGQPGDVYEQEADRVADAVMRMPEPEVQRQVEPEEEEEETLQSKPLASQITPLVQVQRQEEPKEEEEMLETKPLAQEITPLVQRQVEPEEEEEPIMTKALSNRTQQASDSLHIRLNRSRGGGQPLPETDRDFMETRLGVDFSNVRVHTNSDAIQMSRELNAHAFTHGRDIYFGSGRYSPGTSSGKRLLAHELTHVLQQDRGGSSGVEGLLRKDLSNTRIYRNSDGPVQAQVVQRQNISGWDYINFGATSKDNCCPYCNPPAALGVDSMGYGPFSFTNGIEMKATISDHKKGTTYDIKRVKERGAWERINGVWKLFTHVGPGASDDPNDLDECLIPRGTPPHIYSVDQPGFVPITSAVNVNATELVYKGTFTEWVEINGVADSNRFNWHTIMWLEKMGGMWKLTKNLSEIDSGAVKVGKTGP